MSDTEGGREPERYHEGRFSFDEELEEAAAEIVHSPLSTATLATSVIAGLLAAVVGGVAWGFVVKWTDYEVGIAAWAIGLLAGFVVTTVAGGRKSLALSTIAVVCALAGILLGKYLAFAFVLQDAVNEAFGDGSAVGVLSNEMFDAFTEELGTVFGWFDLLWVGLAVYTAWRLTRPEEHGPAAAD